MAFQSALDCLHGFLAQRNALLIHLAAQFHYRMEAFPCHTLRPCQHRLDINQFRPIPVHFQEAPTPFDRIILTVLGWVVQQLNRLANGIAKLHHAL
jgi:hypothetical protein